MGSSNGFYTSSCPEPVPVTIQVTEVKFSAVDAAFKQARYSRTAVSPVIQIQQLSPSLQYRRIVLDTLPVQADSVKVFLNSAIQRRGVEYEVYAREIYLANEPTTDDEFLVTWFSLTGAATAYDVTTGYIASFVTNPGDGWLPLDGASPREKSSYPTLWAYLDANPTLLQSSNSTQFVLKDLSNSFYDGAGYQQIRAYIHV